MSPKILARSKNLQSFFDVACFRLSDLVGMTQKWNAREILAPDPRKTGGSFVIEALPPIVTSVVKLENV